jgi:hypothetical protein
MGEAPFLGKSLPAVALAERSQSRFHHEEMNYAKTNQTMNDLFHGAKTANEKPIYGLQLSLPFPRLEAYKMLVMIGTF